MALAAVRGTVVAIVVAPCDSGTCNLSAIRSPVGSDEFQQLPLPSVLEGNFNGFERHGSAMWLLLGGSQQNRILRSLDGGDHWADVTVRCAPGEAATHLSAASETTLWALCGPAQGGSGQVGSDRGVTVSRDGGMTWGDERDIPTGDRADRGVLGITAASPDRLFLERNSHQIYATDDGAATWRSSLEVPGDDPLEGGLLQIGAQDETHVRVLQFGQTYWWTDDGGRRWQSHTFT